VRVFLCPDARGLSSDASRVIYLPLDRIQYVPVMGGMRKLKPILFVALTPVLVLLLNCQMLAPERPPQISTVLSQMELNRSVTFRLLDEIEKTGKANQILGWSVGDHAPIGWHFMHLAASEDRFAVMLGAPKLVSEDYSTRFSSGKDAPRDVPSISAMRKYLDESRASLIDALERFDLSKSGEKPSADAPFDYGTVIKIISFHEPHHQGQAHATFNLYKDR